MKKIPKKKLDTAIVLTKEYWASGDVTILGKLHRLAEKIHPDLEWTAILDMLHGIFKYQGICPDATEDEIYCALRCLGWEVVDEEHSSN